MSNLQRFIEAQERQYHQALREIINGRKQSHWMWFIFPQIAGLGYSSMSERYAISDLREATDYLNHPVLGKRLLEISKAVLGHQNKTALEIFGSPDNLKLRSCMTLFAAIPDAPLVFQKILDAFYGGKGDAKTLDLLKRG